MINGIKRQYKSILVLAIAMLISGCDVRLPTVNGPESEDLLPQLHGYIIMDRERGIIGIELPSTKEIIIRKPWDKKNNPVDALSGPDNQGRIAFIDSDLGAEIYSLKIIDMATRKETVVFTLHGSYWPQDENYGQSFSYSRTGGMVAFITNYKDDLSLIRNDYVNIGTLEIVKTEKGIVIKTKIKALDKGLAWFPDGKQLVYAALVRKNELPHNLKMQFDDGFGREMNAWHSIPVVFVLDVITMSSRPLHIGWNPIVSSDGSSIFIQDYKGRLRKYIMATHDSISVDIPPTKQSHVFSSIGNDVLLYKGLPTKGSKQKFRFTSTFGTTLYWTLKVAQLTTGKFKTIEQYLDIHRRVSYGEGNKLKNEGTEQMARPDGE